MKNQDLISQLPARLFWDVDLASADDESLRRLIIERSFSLGDFDEIKKVINFYGLEVVKQEIVLAGNLDKKTINWLSIFFKIPKKNFRCYSQIRLHQTHWNY
jgi:hypothetical protein